jgi:arylsulfatase
MGDDIPISIGAEVQEEAVFRSHDLRNEQDHAVVWNQGQVRKGDVCHGYWEVFAERAGDYEFELRRWPKEAGHAVTAGIDGDDVVFRRDGIAPGAEWMYTGGQALKFDTACLDISGMPQQCVEVGPDDAGAVFRVSLERGPIHVRAQFLNCGGAYCAAYYMYVRRVG